MKKLFVFSLLVIVLSGCIVVTEKTIYVTAEPEPTPTPKPTLTRIPTRTPKPTRTPRPTRTPFPIWNPTRTTTPLWSSCDIKYSAASHVMMWAEGNYAHEACRMINTRMDFFSVINNWVGPEYHVICSDEFSDLIYEVIDTGDALYGMEWCHWMYLEYGATSKHGQEDIFGLIGP